MDKKHVVIIGAGPGGYTAAFLAADKGLNVTLINEEKSLGGVCLQRGCIPSKALLHAAKLITDARDASEIGLDFSLQNLNLDKLRDWKNQVVQKMTGGLAQLCKQRGINYVIGHAQFVNSNELKVVDGETFKFDYAIIAVGSVPHIPDSFKDISPKIMDSTSALDLEEIPKRLLVVGGGYIGLEMGTVFSSLGTKVSVIEMMDGLLPGVDQDLVRILQVRLKKEFDSILLKSKVSGIKEVNNELEVSIDTNSGNEKQNFERVLVSIGRVPNSRNLGLGKTNVEVDKNGFIIVDNNLQTNESSIFAIGDVIGGAMLAHKAAHEGKKVVEFLLGHSEISNSNTIPAVVFTDPEIAWCGVTEDQAKAENLSYTIVKFPWGASGRATAMSRNDGQTKLILERETGIVLGVGIVGVGAGELISEGILAVDKRMTAKDLAERIHPHPTLSETLMEAAEVHEGFPTHIFKRPRR